MIEEPPLLRIRRPARRPTPDQIAALERQPTGFLVDAMEGRGAFAADMALLDPVALPARFTGVALTCENGPDDLMGVMAALTQLQPGDVLVAACGGWRGSALIGDRVAGMLRNGGATGFVTDGLVRDHEGLVEAGLPIVCTGMSPNSPVAKGPAAVGEPVTLGGVRVATGDFVVADRTGTVVVPFERIDEVIATTARIAEMETELDAKVAAGLKVPDAIAELVAGDQVRWL